MINPQTTTLKQAYDPYLTMERLMFLDGSLDYPLLDRIPDASDETFVWAFNFDHEHTLIHVMVKNYVSLSVARDELLMLMWNHRKVFKCGGVTDRMSESMYQELTTTCDDWQWGVNSHDDLGKDA